MCSGYHYRLGWGEGVVILGGVDIGQTERVVVQKRVDIYIFLAVRVEGDSFKEGRK